MRGRSLLGLAVLAAGTSCVPPRSEPRAAGMPRAEPVAVTPSEAALLRSLALTPPEPAALPATPAVAMAELAAAPPFTPAARSENDAARARECLTAAVYYEARSEPLDGQRAVAQVVLNRVRDRAFPASVCGVVYQRTATVCQFSFACDGSTDRPRDYAAWARAAAVAQAAYDGAVFAPVGASTHFHTAAIHPWWAPSLARVGRIGAHVFYGWRGAMGQALTFRRAYAGLEPGADPAPIADGIGIDRMVEMDAADIVAGVAIHRGTDSSGEAAASTPTGRMIMTAGVRIHRGTTASSIDDEQGAEIGPELDVRPEHLGGI